MEGRGAGMEGRGAVRKGRGWRGRCWKGAEA